MSTRSLVRERELKNVSLTRQHSSRIRERRRSIQRGVEKPSGDRQREDDRGQPSVVVREEAREGAHFVSRS